MKYVLMYLGLFSFSCAFGQHKKAKLIPVDSAWASNSVNTTVFRKNSLVTHNNTQFIAYYNAEAYVVLGKRNLHSSEWILHQTQYRGNAADAHDVISLMVDGDGYLHLSWGMHNNPLRYCKSIAPYSLSLGEEEHMTGLHEEVVSYPEFYYLQNGNLLFFYRDGGSGNGNLVINRYDKSLKKWTQLQSNLIDGEGERNAYWQACTDKQGTIHISWVWRESPDVASNHDMCYACSKDGGITWQTSAGKQYGLPITEATAEYAYHIPQHSELINQTSMFADEKGLPYIATYWKDSGAAAPQYHLIYKEKNSWYARSLSFRTKDFKLGGGGTKRIPIARPQVIAWQTGKRLSAALLFRDEERGSKVSVAVTRNISQNKWKIEDITPFSVVSWEPSYDTELWKNKKRLHLFIEPTDQVDGEGKSSIGPQPVFVAEWKP